jgi:aconitase B
VNNITQGEEREEMYNAFLWNVPPDGTVSPALKIGSINVGTDIVLTLMADYASPATVVTIDTTQLNNGAVFKVLGKVSLSDSTWHDFGSNLTFNPVVPPNTNQFFKADISIP